MNGFWGPVLRAVATTALVVVGVSYAAVGCAIFAHAHQVNAEAELWTVLDQQLKNRQLVAIQSTSDHWLLVVLYQAKRLELRKTLRNERSARPTYSCEELKTKLLKTVLSELKPHGLLNTKEDIYAWSGRVVLLASVFSELLPEFEPLLVELALTHCLHEWSSKDRGDKGDIKAFEAFLTAELRGDRSFWRRFKRVGVVNWFGCQLVVDTVDILRLSRYFYKQQITNKPLRELIATTLVASKGDNDRFVVEMLINLARPENNAAADAWTAWLQEEIGTIGSFPRTQKGNSGLVALSGRVINATHFYPDKRAYFPLGMQLEGIGATNCGDLSGVITTKTTTSSEDTMDTMDMMAPGFIYQGGELQATEAS